MYSDIFLIKESFLLLKIHILRFLKYLESHPSKKFKKCVKIPMNARH